MTYSLKEVQKTRDMVARQQRIEETKKVLKRLEQEKRTKALLDTVHQMIWEDKMQKFFAENMRRLDEAFPRPAAFKPSVLGWVGEGEEALSNKRRF